MSERVYRVQAVDGRGPFRPGFSIRWCDTEGDDRPPTLMEEFPNLEFKPGFHFGTGVRKLEDINRWFTEIEQVRLCELGFNVVSMDVDKILAESKNQIVFARKQPLMFGALIVPWPRQVKVQP